MTCDELERILLNNSIPPGFKRQDSLNSCSGATTKSSRQTPVSSGMNFFLDLYDDLGNYLYLYISYILLCFNEFIF